ncbi:mechanosensory protein 2-like isoform X5 [Maniola jurtina]|uniref:mechanosensory protein 2-like isoform X5 n=1 Tax=Maniola jurtina TaxID=191418 RepID=UPI001E68776B|nr:mechanosensory protein 2-like isoform X5 [Maniola jurtina]
MQSELRSVSTRRDNVPSHCDTGMTCAITIQMPNPEATGCVEKFATFFSFLLVIVTFPFSLFECFKVLTRDSVTVAVDAVVYYRIKEPLNAVIRVADYSASTRLLAATTLRNVLGMRDLAQLLSDREAISHMMQTNLDVATDPWGVEVERVEIKDVRLPVQLQRAMAAEAEADREARAKIIAAEGEIKASKALREASLVMIDNPTALQLRYLQSLNTISAEKNSTIIFPFPMDFLKTFLSGGGAGPSIPPPPLPI